MITKVSDTPCWVIPLGGDDDTTAHFPTLDEAHESARKWAVDGERTYTIEQLSGPCWTATCDGEGCLAEEINEDGWAIHFTAYTARHVLADLQELREAEGRLLCSDCHDRAYPPAEPVPPTAARPTVITYDELGRVFGLLLYLVDELQPGEQSLFDTDSHNALALVQSFVTRQPAAAPGGWSMHVGPFAVQPPLPEMPTPPITGRSLR